MKTSRTSIWLKNWPADDSSKTLTSWPSTSTLSSAAGERISGTRSSKRTVSTGDRVRQGLPSAVDRHSLKFIRTELVLIEWSLTSLQTECGSFRGKGVHQKGVALVLQVDAHRQCGAGVGDGVVNKGDVGTDGAEVDGLSKSRHRSQVWFVLASQSHRWTVEQRATHR